MSWKRCLVMVCILSAGVWSSEEGGDDTPGHFTHRWAVHVDGGRHVADRVAVDHGFINLGEIFQDHYHFHHNSVRRRSISPSNYHHRKLSADDRVRWAKQQRILSRKKRDFLPFTDVQGTTFQPVRNAPSTVQKTVDPTASSQIVASISTSANYKTTENSASNVGQSTVNNLVASTAGPNRTDRDLLLPFMTKLPSNSYPPGADLKFPLSDSKWPQMWYLHRGGGLDMNVIPAWREGITGKGVVVAILDDGLEMDHPDLIANYDPQASYDVNNHDEDPSPRYDMVDSNRHGTRCAGEVAATANNSLCAVGVAYGASVGGVRMLDGDVTDAVEARSLSLNPQHIDIYSASWGPDDDGKSVDGPGELATRAFIEGVTKGRAGKGSIFVWASGNGGRDHDNCNCDGYTNSIWTLSISSATEKGEVPWYSEMCSSTLATTYSSGSTNDKQVVTTDLHHSCTTSHTGTSASAPLAAGICALVLEANRDLTWRDMQHIVVRTAKPANLATSGWRTNGVGRNVSHSFGYGLMDASAMVRLARSWRTVPQQRHCEVSAPHVDKLIPAKSQVVLQLAVNHCAGVNYLEHVQAKITLSAARRGDLQINLTSPAGTKTTLLASRSHDISRNGFVSWPFMSVHTWGESPYGIWQLEIHNEGRYLGSLSQWGMIFYGTEVPAQEGLDLVPGTVPNPLGQVELNMGEGEAGQHNSIESDRTSSRWRDTQKIREDGRVDKQGAQDSITDDSAATSGCLSFVATEPQHCIGLCLFLLVLLHTFNIPYASPSSSKTTKRRPSKVTHKKPAQDESENDHITESSENDNHTKKTNENGRRRKETTIVSEEYDALLAIDNKLVDNKNDSVSISSSNNSANMCESILSQLSTEILISQLELIDDRVARASPDAESRSWPKSRFLNNYQEFTNKSYPCKGSISQSLTRSRLNGNRSLKTFSDVIFGSSGNYHPSPSGDFG